MYLLNTKARVLTILMLGAFAFLTVVQTQDFTLDKSDYYRPYSVLIFALLIAISLLSMRKDQWRAKVKILTLTVTVSMMLFVTTVQLNSLHGWGEEYLNYERTKNKQGEYNFENAASMSQWVSNEINLSIAYRLGKIILFNSLAVFIFYAVNKTVDSIKLKDEL
jgi:hypothetical protein